MHKKEPEIIFEDDFILVINKPAGWIVNRADTTKNNVTVQEWAEEKFRIKNLELPPEVRSSAEQAGLARDGRIEIDDEEFYKRGGIVHRLDKETSGLLIIAKTPFAFRNLQAQFKEGKVEKTYLALCHGKVAPRTGEINVPIGRLPWNRTRFGVIPEGREAKTFYEVIEYKTLGEGKENEILSLLRLYPKTGRTHQIRVHLRHLGFPIFADELYAGRKVGKHDRKLLSRHFLHAAEIKFYHPMDNSQVRFESPLPSELTGFMARLK